VARDQSKFVLVVGCGRLGSYLASTLSRDGHSVVVVDSREQAFEELSADFSGFKIEGDATEFEVLRAAKAEKADIVIAATDRDNVNLMIAQIARKVFGVDKVVARIFEMKRDAVCQDLGVEVVCPTTILGDIIIDSVRQSAGRRPDEGRK